ncbi:MAG: hypothetical protein ACREE0_16470 [Phenylobacterium sp.]
MLRTSLFITALLSATATVTGTAGATPAVATTSTQVPSSPDAVVDTFFTGLKSGDVEPAFRKVFGLLMTQKPAEAQNLVAQTSLALRMAGRVRGWELIRERQLSASFVERFYLLNADAPLFYRFLLYRVDGAWTVYAIAFNDQYDKLPGVASLP